MTLRERIEKRCAFYLELPVECVRDQEGHPELVRVVDDMVRRAEPYEDMVDKVLVEYHISPTC